MRFLLFYFLKPRSQVRILIYYMTSSVSGQDDKMKRISRCDWLPERARWSYLARSGYGLCPLLTKLVRSRWLDNGLVLFLRVYGPRG